MAIAHCFGFIDLIGNTCAVGTYEGIVLKNYFLSKDGSIKLRKEFEPIIPYKPPKDDGEYRLVISKDIDQKIRWCHYFLTEFQLRDEITTNYVQFKAGNKLISVEYEATVVVYEFSEFRVYHIDDFFRETKNLNSLFNYFRKPNYKETLLDELIQEIYSTNPDYELIKAICKLLHVANEGDVPDWVSFIAQGNGKDTLEYVKFYHLDH